MPTEGLQITKFSEAADLSDEILKAVEKMGFSEMTPVQAKTLPLMMEGRDLIAIAPTGTGKTCAFGIPMLEYVSLKDKRVQELVLAPTRELSLQITDELRALVGVQITVAEQNGEIFDFRPGGAGRVRFHAHRRPLRRVFQEDNADARARIECGIQPQCQRMRRCGGENETGVAVRCGVQRDGLLGACADVAHIQT